MEAPKITVNVAVLDNDALLPACAKAIWTSRSRTPGSSRNRTSPSSGFGRMNSSSTARPATVSPRKSITLHDLAQERWAAATSASGAFGPLLVLREAFEERGLPAPRLRSCPIS